MTSTSLAVEKEQVRRRILKLREQQTIREIEQKSLKITGSVETLPDYQKARTIASYVGKGSEVQTRPLIQKSLSLRKKVLVPVVEQGTTELLFSQIASVDELVPGHFGIAEPDPSLTRPTPLATADLVFVPGIAWDLEGYRLGWGRGYFDATLRQLSDDAVSVGLSFELQLLDKLPREQFDLPVDLIVTENRVVHCHD